MLARTEYATQIAGLIGPDGHALEFEAPRVWTALIARSSKEQDAADWLKERRFFAYWPCFLKHVAHGNGTTHGTLRRYPRFTALIPGYLFVAARAGEPIKLGWIVDQAPGIISFMRDGSGRPATLTEDDIETIRRIEAGQNLPPPEKGDHRYKSGDKVRFTDDLKGQWGPGKIIAIAKDGRIGIHVPLLRRVVLMWAYAHQIEAM